jgi:3D (Asp-Asp-Asp) domain-containing protein
MKSHINASQGVRRNRPVFEAAMFVVAAVLVAMSAASAKMQGNPTQLAEVVVTHADPALATIAATIETAKSQPTAVRYFNGRPIEPLRTVWMTVTAYSPDARSCDQWADGVTASNKSIWTNGMKLVAADTRQLPLGTMLSIPGYDAGATVPVLDRGGAIKDARLDVLFPSHNEALQWGVKRLPVTIWQYADEG